LLRVGHPMSLVYFSGVSVAQAPSTPNRLDSKKSLPAPHRTG
jgi:hypothetical protein